MVNNNILYFESSTSDKRDINVHNNKKKIHELQPFPSLGTLIFTTSKNFKLL